MSTTAQGRWLHAFVAPGRRTPGSRSAAHRATLIQFAAGVLALGGLTIMAFAISPLGRLDAQGNLAFLMLRGARDSSLARALVDTVSPVPAVLVVLLCLAVAGLRHRPGVALTVAVVGGGANLSTQILKSLIGPHAYVVLGGGAITVSSFPSGHATAAMSLVLAVLLVIPPRARVVLAPLGALYAVAVGYATLLLDMHYPSDVLAGYLVAGLWALGVRTLAGERSDRAMSQGRDSPAQPGAAMPMVWVAALSTSAIAAGALLSPGETRTPTLSAVALIVAIVGVLVVAAVTRTATVSSTRAEGPCKGNVARGVTRQ